MLGQLLLPEIEELLENRDFRQLRDTLAELPSHDLADLIEDLEDRETIVVFRLLPQETATDVFERLGLDSQKALLEALKSQRVREIIEDMSPDDRTALLEELPAQAASRLLMMLSPEERQVAQSLLNYPEDSVGRRMTPDYVFLSPGMTVEESLAKIRKLGFDGETVYALYVVDPVNHRLMGFVSLRKLVTASLGTRVSELMDENIASIDVNADQEEAADMLSRLDVIALPVVDQDKRMLGIITFDDVLDVLEEEFTEDAQMQAAIIPVEESYLSARVWDLAGRRMFWLVILLLAETIGVLFLRRYDQDLQTWIVLALFLPVMVATGGNTGTQAAALIIRALATGEADFGDIKAIIRRELIISALLSILLGALGWGIVMVLEGNATIALCIGLGLAAIVTMSNLVGTLLPLLLERLRLDPALMSGPFISTLIDVAGLVIYLELSLAILN